MIIEKIYERKLQDYLQHKKEENTFYVTDLVKCPLKLRYENQYKELITGEFFSPAAVMGELVHHGLEDFLKSEFNAQVEVEGEREAVIDGKTIKIRGRADAIIEKDGEKVVIEIKSTRTDKNLPLDHHKLQLQIYLWMFNTKKGLLVYITPDRVTEYKVDSPLDEAEVLRLVREAIRMNKAPKYAWECSYCRFSIVCPRKVVTG